MNFKRRLKLVLYVTTPATIGEAEVTNAINAALDEPPCDWGDWFVDGVTVESVIKVKE